MARNIRIHKTVVSKDDFDKVVDTSFTAFKNQEVEEDEDLKAQFFNLYEKLYYELPLNGEEDSHEFLIRESSKLVDLEKDTEDIQPLLDEITQLRRQLLELNTQLTETEFANEQEILDHHA